MDRMKKIERMCRAIVDGERVRIDDVTGESVICRPLKLVVTADGAEFEASTGLASSLDSDLADVDEIHTWTGVLQGSP